MRNSDIFLKERLNLKIFFPKVGFEPTNPGMEDGRGTKVPSCLYRLGELFGCAYLLTGVHQLVS